MKKLLTALTIVLFIQCAAIAKRDYPERYYQNEWCNKYFGVQEYELSDKTRVDCLTTNYAVEFDFAQKWAESIGQSLHYAEMTSKNPAIVLIIEKPLDFIYYYRIKRLCNKHGIKLWYIKSPLYGLH